jgi:hypothetical protein
VYHPPQQVVVAAVVEQQPVQAPAVEVQQAQAQQSCRQPALFFLPYMARRAHIHQDIPDIREVTHKR